MSCTLIMPTFNRPLLLKRQLAYCAAVFPDLAVWVADGSEGEVAEANRRAVLESGHPKVVYHPFPGRHIWQRAVELLETVTTPYSMLFADDDFALPEGVHAAIRFLDEHPDYVSAQGITVGLPGPSLKGKVGWHLNSLLGEISAESPAERMAHHFAAYSHTIYSVHRTAVLLAGLRLASQPPFTMDTICLGELAQSLVTVLAGKAVWLDVPYSCRCPSISRWPSELEITAPAFSDCLGLMRERVMQASEEGKADLAGKLFNTCYATYFSQGKHSLKSAAFDVWPWQSDRQTVMHKPDLHEVYGRLRSSTAWQALVAAYPEAGSTPLKRRRFKHWVRSLIKKKS